MAVLAATQTVAIALLAVLVAGLLRSHARVLATLQQQGIGLDGSGNPEGPGLAVPGPATVPAGLRPATDLVGVTPADETVRIAVVGVRADTLLAFLSGGCPTCTGLWAGLEEGESSLPDRTRLVVVTMSPQHESPGRIGGLADPGVAVVMSSDAWQDYNVPGAPYFVHVSGAIGEVVGEGSARTWSQVLSLMGEAGEGRRGDRSEDRVDAELAAAGIVPGDPRLHRPTIAGPVD